MKLTKTPNPVTVTFEHRPIDGASFLRITVSQIPGKGWRYRCAMEDWSGHTLEHTIHVSEADSLMGLTAPREALAALSTFIDSFID